MSNPYFTNNARGGWLRVFIIGISDAVTDKIGEAIRRETRSVGEKEKTVSIEIEAR